jgi:hypothetical protein
MPKPTYSHIQTQTLGSSTGTVNFSNISGYTHLRLVMHGKAAANTGVGIRFNGDTAANYGAMYLEAPSASSTPVSENYRSVDLARLAWNGYWQSSYPTMMVVDIHNYANSGGYKTIQSKNGNAYSYLEYALAVWKNTAPITSIAIIGTGQNFLTGSTFTLHGIKAE